MKYLISIVLGLFISFSHATVYHAKLGPIEPNQEIADLLYMLKVGKATDTLVLTIDSPGGSVRLMTNIIEEMSQSDMKIVCVTQWQVASAAALITFDECLNHHTLKIHPLSVVLFHYPYSCGDSQCNEIIPIDGEDRKEVRKYYKDMMSNILTKVEQDRMYYHNEDIILTGQQIIDRLKKVKTSKKK